MKKTITMSRGLYALMLIALGFTACKKSDLMSTSQVNADAIVVAASLTTATSQNDSIYIVQFCNRSEKKDSIAQSALPTSVTAYLSTNYAGYTFAKAFAISDNSSTLTGYVVVIYYNDKPVAIKFDTSGAFVKVLEQRQKGDLDGAGWHRGGRFEGRGGIQNDTIALSALPASVTSYMSSNFATDTLVKAFKGCDSSIIIISNNNGVFATVFNASGNFVKRDQLHSRQGKGEVIDQSALPAAISSYLNTTYPNYVFRNAFVIKQNGTVVGYVVFIDANGTKYAVEFDASGSFVRSKTVR